MEKDSPCSVFLLVWYTSYHRAAFNKRACSGDALRERGYKQVSLIPVFTKGITGALTFIKCGSVRRCVTDKEKDTKGRVFFHLTYHPRDPISKSLQRQWRQHLLHPLWELPLWRLKDKNKTPIGIRSMCVAYSRPKNLGNIFTYRRIDRLDGPLVSSYLE